jgi:8-oxo-dGTP diphosphatase
VTVYLLRHARAGRRSTWKGDDERRPLTKVGRRQAAGILGVLGEAPITRIVSSPYVRCQQSVEPLARRLNAPIEVVDGLAEGVDLHEVLRVLEKVSDQTTVLCTHGDVIELLLGHLRSDGINVGKRRGRPLMEKGSVWELETKRGRVIGATYLPPPRPPGK